MTALHPPISQMGKLRHQGGLELSPGRLPGGALKFSVHWLPRFEGHELRGTPSPPAAYTLRFQQSLACSLGTPGRTSVSLAVQWAIERIRD